MPTSTVVTTPTPTHTKYAPRGVGTAKMIGLRLKPEERASVEALAASEQRATAAMARLLLLKGLEQHTALSK